MGLYYVNPIMWALAISLSTFAGVWTFISWRRRAWRSLVRGVALMVLPFGLLFTGSLTLAMRILDAITLWATRLVFSPSVWVGGALVVLSVVLLLVARRVPQAPGRRSSRRSLRRTPADGALPASPAPARGAPVDDEMAEIEAILRRRGIT
ncbi:MAG: hypothetical protein U0R80_12755 [Nocardioidaceae bacterium]